MTIWRNILIVLCLTGLLAACGVNGRPELPPGAEKPNPEEPSPLDQLI